jgi:hypothetical protein
VRIRYALIGFLVHAIVQRIDTGQSSDIAYPIAILGCVVTMTLLRELPNDKAQILSEAK